LQRKANSAGARLRSYTRYLTIVLSIIQSFTIAQTLQAASGPGGQSMVYHPGWGFTLMTILTLTTGSAFIMWLGEQISERGIGNGMSLIIFVGIVVGLPRAVVDLYEKAKTQAWGPFTPLALILLIALMIAVVAFIVFVEGGQRRIPVQYAKRVVGRRVMGGQSSYLPLRVNIRRRHSADFCEFAAGISGHCGADFWNSLALSWRILPPLSSGASAVHVDLCDADFGVRVLYVGIVFNPTELADNMRKNGGFIPGIRPGRTTSEHVSKILKRLTFIGAVYWRSSACFRNG